MASEKSNGRSGVAREAVAAATRPAPAAETGRSKERADYEVDERTGAKVIDSIVLRGDLSGLGPSERARFYVQMCEGLGLNPHAQPFAFLRLNGKEILYATRGATDQLAAMHRVNRKIVDGPKVIDLAGTKLVYAVCEASMPNGRVETATATVPLVDPVNVLMKVETKAKRRATLSILGLGVLDELEIETIPAGAQEPGGGVDLDRAREGSARRSALPASFHQAAQGVATVEAAVALWTGPDLAGLLATPQAEQDAALEALVKRVREGGASASADEVRAAIREGIAKVLAARTLGGDAPADEAAAEEPSPETVHPALGGFYARVGEIELPGEAVAVWMKYRAELGPLPVADREAAWRALCKRTEEVGRMKNAKVWLRKAIEEEDNRRKLSGGSDSQAA